MYGREEEGQGQGGCSFLFGSNFTLAEALTAPFVRSDNIILYYDLAVILMRNSACTAAASPAM
jgi:hypothetical protein